MKFQKYDFVVFLVPGPQGTPADGGFNIMMILLAWVVVATALYLFRPGSLRQSGDDKPARHDNVSPLSTIPAFFSSILNIQ